MTEFSIPWSGEVIGDAGPYSHEVWSDLWLAFFGESDAVNKGVLRYSGNELEASGAVSPVQIDTGAAIVDGTYYYNTAAVNVVIPTPLVSTRYDRLVLRKDWLAQTVRIYRIAGIEGGGAPSITQTDGLVWDLKQYLLSITTLGAITLVDERIFISLKRNVPNSIIIPVSATPAINVDIGDLFRIGVPGDLLDLAITSMTANLSGSPYHGQRMIIEFLDDGTGRAIAWGASYRDTEIPLPDTTTASKLMRVGLMYDSVDGVWDCVASVEVA